MLNISARFVISAARNCAINSTTTLPNDTQMRALVSRPVVGEESNSEFAFSVALTPNPGSGARRFALRVPASLNEAVGQIDIYDVRGARAWNRDIAAKGSGNLIVDWDGRRDNGQTLSRGVYFYRVVLGSTVIKGQILNLPSSTVGEPVALLPVAGWTSALPWSRAIDVGSPPRQEHSGVIPDDDGGGGGGGPPPSPTSWPAFVQRVAPFMSMGTNGQYSLNEAAASASGLSAADLVDAREYKSALNAFLLAGFRPAGRSAARRLNDLIHKRLLPAFRDACGTAINYDSTECPPVVCAASLDWPTGDGSSTHAFWLTEDALHTFLRDVGFHVVDYMISSEQDPAKKEDWARPGPGPEPCGFPTIQHDNRLYKPYRDEVKTVPCLCGWTFTFQSAPREPDPEYAWMQLLAHPTDPIWQTWFAYTATFHFLCNPDEPNCCPAAAP
jgi:hypothetical protein